jgi:hypothetical protein
VKRRVLWGGFLAVLVADVVTLRFVHLPPAAQAAAWASLALIVSAFLALHLLDWRTSDANRRAAFAALARARVPGR